MATSNTETDVGNVQISLDTQQASVTRSAGTRNHDLPSFYRPELDGLRFFAFLAVFVSHSLPHTVNDYNRIHLPRTAALLMSAIASAGAFGVQLFFLLSAFLITSLLLREKDARGEVHLKSFYIRRILRIWPLYFFALAIAALWPLRAERMPLNYLAAYLLLAGNWMTVFLGAPKTFMSILWSVSIEEQFYLSWPLVLRKSSRRTLITIAVGLIIVANVTRFVISMGPLTEHSVFPNTFAQLDSIALGILSAIFLKERLHRSVLTRLALGAIGLSALVVCGHFSSRADAAFARFGYPIVAFAALLLFAAVYGFRLTFKPLIYFGKISYGLYVYHVLAIHLMGHLLGDRAGTLFRFFVYWFGALILTMLFASTSYRYLEAPFLRLKERFAFVKSRPV